MKLNIEYLNKEELKPYANNAKVHTDEQVEQIKHSIEEFGFNDPIAIWKNNEVVEGHGRLIAVMEMDEITEVPVIRLDELTDEQRRAYMLAHNKLTMNTGFDSGLLGMELSELVSEIDMTMLGFSELEISLATNDFLPDDYDDDMLSEYEGHGEQFLVNNRIIITYSDEQTDMLCEFLNINKDNLKVTYNIADLVEAGK